MSKTSYSNFPYQYNHELNVLHSYMKKTSPEDAYMNRTIGTLILVVFTSNLHKSTFHP